MSDLNLDKNASGNLKVEDNFCLCQYMHRKSKTGGGEILLGFFLSRSRARRTARAPAHSYQQGGVICNM